LSKTDEAYREDSEPDEERLDASQLTRGAALGAGVTVAGALAAVIAGAAAEVGGAVASASASRPILRSRLRIAPVIDQAMVDPKKAELLRAQAQAALTAGVGSPEWQTLMRNFVSSPLQLAQFQRDHAKGGPQEALSWRTYLTTFSLMTAPVNVTTGAVTVLSVTTTTTTTSTW
jgi:hypothetical protein